jgi:hypothetical protein
MLLERIGTIHVFRETLIDSVILTTLVDGCVGN